MSTTDRNPQLSPGDTLPNPYNAAEDWIVVSVAGDCAVIRWANGSETIGTIDGSAMRNALAIKAIREASARLDADEAAS